MPAQPTKLKDLASAVSDMLSIPLDQFEVDPTFNARTEGADLDAHIRYIADSIKGSGFRRDKPLTVQFRDGKALIRAGHCRYRAALLAVSEGAEILALPALPEARGTTDADRALELITGNSGKPLEALEQAEVIKRLISFDWDMDKIALRLGRSRQWVSDLLTLAEAPESVRKLVAAGTVSPTQAWRTMKTDGAEAGEVLQRAVEALPAGKTRVTAKTVERSRPAGARVSVGPDRRVKAAWDTVEKAQELLELWAASPSPKMVDAGRNALADSGFLTDNTVAEADVVEAIIRAAMAAEFAEAMEALRVVVP